MKFGGSEGPRRGEAGSAAVEALTATLILCLIFFGLMQIFQWVAGTMIAEYASTYAAGAYARGYTPLFTMRAGRVAAAGISGRDRSTPAIGMKSGQEYIEYRLSSYLENARTSGVEFIGRSVGLEQLCASLQAHMEETYGSVNNQSLDDIRGSELILCILMCRHVLAHT